MRTCFLLGILGVFFATAISLPAGEPCASGLQCGQRPGPYAFVIATGQNRGQSFCYICETAEKPAVLIFARRLSDPLGKLAAQLDKSIADHKSADMRGWITFLSDDQPSLDPQVVRWGQKHALRNVPLGVFEDAGGPPSYRLNRDADVTVLFFVKQKVVANHAFRDAELTEERIAEVMKSLPKIVGEKK